MSSSSDFDPSVPIPSWHQNLELVVLCITNSVSLTIIIARLWIRYSQSKAFRKDDYWIAGAGAALIFPHWVCQLATNRYGSGLHVQNIPEHRFEMYWQFSRGWIGYYLVCSMIKVSVCYCLLQILPESYRAFRLIVRGISVAIMGLGVAVSLVWIFQCQPFLSNFVYSVEPDWCADMDAARFAWVGFSVGFDAVITWIPFVLVKRVQVEPHKRNALMVVFGANLLGSITCLVGIYGVWMNRNSQSDIDLTYSGTPFVIINDLEILMYTVGASATVASKYLVSKAGAIAGFVSSSRMAVFSRRKGYKGDDLEHQSRIQTPSEQYVRRNSDNVELIEVRINGRKLQRGTVKSTATGGR